MTLLLWRNAFDGAYSSVTQNIDWTVLWLLHYYTKETCKSVRFVAFEKCLERVLDNENRQTFHIDSIWHFFSILNSSAFVTGNNDFAKASYRPFSWSASLSTLYGLWLTLLYTSVSFQKVVVIWRLAWTTATSKSALNQPNGSVQNLDGHKQVCKGLLWMTTDLKRAA